jgi:hypothetical protein
VGLGEIMGLTDCVTHGVLVKDAQILSEVRNEANAIVGALLLVRRTLWLR